MSKLERILLGISAATLMVFAVVRLTPPVRGWAEPPETLLQRPSLPFALALVTGDTVELPREGRRTLVIAYRTDCRFCEASRPSWERAFSAACDVDVALVSAEPLELLREHWSQHGFTGCADIALGRVIDAAAFQAGYDVTGTPRHYLIGVAGMLERLWPGAVRGRGSERNFIAGLMP